VKIEKKSLLLLSGFFFIVLGLIVGRISNYPIKNSLGPAIPVSPTETSLVTPSLVLETAKVTRVIDGDTIQLEDGQRLRYLGIDTPETVDPRKPVQCFGVEASEKNKELVEGKTVRLEKDITDKDKYGRLLRYVHLDNLFINLELVKQGFATSYTYPPDVKYQSEILQAEKEAREANRGLWAACLSPEPALDGFSSPSPQNTSENGKTCLIKGNINTSGEKIYHLPGCGSYSKTQIDESRGERWFCSEDEAKSAGWRKALNCP